MVNRLTQIYTKTGDEGKTGLGDGTRVAKFSTPVSYTHLTLPTTPYV